MQQRCEQATSHHALTEPQSVTVPLDFATLLSEVTRALAQKIAKYTRSGQALDALVSVDFQTKYPALNAIAPDVAPLKVQGWRSVSLLFPPFGVVLFADTAAPDFLRAAAGRTYMKWEETPDTLFEA